MIAPSLIAVIIFGAYFWLVRKTGNAFPGTSLLATHDANPRLFASYYFVAALAFIVSAIWLLIAIFQEVRS